MGNGLAGGGVGPIPQPHFPPPAGGRPAHCGSFVPMGAPLVDKRSKLPLGGAADRGGG
jgi:hypothetical protein